MTDNPFSLRVDWRKFLPFLIVAAGILAYANSFSGAFVFDDGLVILENWRVRNLWFGWSRLVRHNRWVVDLTFAVNYAMNGLNMADYHATNLAIHVLAGLFLFGIVRRTFASPRLAGRYGRSSSWLALAAALVWTVHPLQTESVTYICQRYESMAGLFYLLTLYCAVRGFFTTQRSEVKDQPVLRSVGFGVASEQRTYLFWYGAAILACAVGMGTKEAMVTAPVMVIMYDRVFVSGSFRELFRKRGLFYVCMALTWCVLAVSWMPEVVRRLPLHLASGNLTAARGRSVARIPWLTGSRPSYVLTQFGVVTHYLRLSVFPYPLCIDYNWPTARSLTDILPQAFFITCLVLTTLWALFRIPPLGFPGFWFFLLIAPTSLIVPLIDNAVEHRMYLPLAGVIVLLDVGAYEMLTLFSRRLGMSEAALKRMLILLLTVVVAVFTALTLRRNADYRSAESIWADVAARRPLNPRGHQNLGSEIAEQGRFREAIPHFREALRLWSGYAQAHNNLGLCLIETGRIAEGLEHCRKALELAGDQDAKLKVDVHLRIAYGLAKSGDIENAVDRYEKVIKMMRNKPRPELMALAHYRLGEIFDERGELDLATAHYCSAIQAVPDYAPPHNNLGIILIQRGRVRDGITHLREAVRIRPEYAEAHYNLGAALFRLGRRDAALFHLEESVRIDPANEKTRELLEAVRTMETIPPE